ncbi:uncharacterized protein LOC134221998 [Armigeres subalbatus]|uniref:uncharacterized protein LOC134221998 n=1 Tax=Armigeres subalbatus TaxID=124917 RepID=UPI002ED0F933
MYDGVLRIKLSPGVKLVGEWLRSKQLQLAHHKTEMIVVNNRKTVQETTIIVGGGDITSKRSLKQLGMMFDDKLSSKSHVDYGVLQQAQTAGKRGDFNTAIRRSSLGVGVERKLQRAKAGGCVITGMMPIKLVVKED